MIVIKSDYIDFSIAPRGWLCYSTAHKEVGELRSPVTIMEMEWGPSSILALRRHAQWTQAQLAHWLGVTIKQVKHLERARRNPSGPTSRLLDILAADLKFNAGFPVQMVTSSVTTLEPVAKPAPRREAVRPVEPQPEIAVVEVESASNDAMIWA